MSKSEEKPIIDMLAYEKFISLRATKISAVLTRQAEVLLQVLYVQPP